MPIRRMLCFVSAFMLMVVPLSAEEKLPPDIAGVFGGIPKSATQGIAIRPAKFFGEKNLSGGLTAKEFEKFLDRRGIRDLLLEHSLSDIEVLGFFTEKAETPNGETSITLFWVTRTAIDWDKVAAFLQKGYGGPDRFIIRQRQLNGKPYFVGLKKTDQVPRFAAVLTNPRTLYLNVHVTGTKPNPLAVRAIEEVITQTGQPPSPVGRQLKSLLTDAHLGMVYNPNGMQSYMDLVIVNPFTYPLMQGMDSGTCSLALSGKPRILLTIDLPSEKDATNRGILVNDHLKPGIVKMAEENAKKPNPDQFWLKYFAAYLQPMQATVEKNTVRVESSPQVFPDLDRDLADWIQNDFPLK